jgi:ubiquinone/menaquinone biosynthesis C-methylase UbiE
MQMPETTPPATPHAHTRGTASAVTLISRINAVFFHCMDWYMHWKYSRLKSELFAGLPDRVVEIGAGAGANMRYFRAGTRLIAAEPNRFMHEKLGDRARRHRVELVVHDRGAETLGLEAESVDAVVATLVLCTVRNPEAALREVLRVLRPGGRFVCIEHVAAPESSLVGRLQRLVYRPWRWFFDGCHTHRDTASLLQSSGFSDVSIQSFTWRSAFVPVRPQIAAVCVK